MKCLIDAISAPLPNAASNAGISKIRTLMAEAGFSPVEFEFDTFFTVTFSRPQHEEAQVGLKDAGIKLSERLIREGINDGINEGIKRRLIEELLYVKQNGSVTRPIIERICHISAATAERDISHLKRFDLIKFEGARKTGRYVLTDKGKQLMSKEI